MDKKQTTNEIDFFCQFCPCTWCDGNKKGNEKITGYDFIPDLNHCKKMFEQEEELPFDTFLKAIFSLYGTTVNKDWHRWLNDSEESKNTVTTTIDLND